MGLPTTWGQSNVSVNTQKGTMRGLHYQSAPNEEAKLTRCTAGAIYGVIVVLRPASPTYCQHVGITLSADNRRAVYVPKCCAYGFLTLEQNSEVPYHMPELHVPASARGFRWDDPAFKIAWPAPIGVMWERDRTWSTFIKSSSTLPS